MDGGIAGLGEKGEKEGDTYPCNAGEGRRWSGCLRDMIGPLDESVDLLPTLASCILNLGKNVTVDEIQEYQYDGDVLGHKY